MFITPSWKIKGFPEIWLEIAQLQCANVTIRPKLSSAMMLSGAFAAVLLGAALLFRFVNYNGAETFLFLHIIFFFGWCFFRFFIICFYFIEEVN